MERYVFQPIIMGCPMVSSFTRFKSALIRQISSFFFPSSRFCPTATMMLMRGLLMGLIMPYFRNRCPLRLSLQSAILLSMAINAGIFGDTTSFEHRYIPDHERLAELVVYWKKLGLKIVLTSGTFDLLYWTCAVSRESKRTWWFTYCRCWQWRKGKERKGHIDQLSPNKNECRFFPIVDM